MIATLKKEGKFIFSLRVNGNIMVIRASSFPAQIPVEKPTSSSAYSKRPSSGYIFPSLFGAINQSRATISSLKANDEPPLSPAP